MGKQILLYGSLICLVSLAFAQQYDYASILQTIGNLVHDEITEHLAKNYLVKTKGEFSAIAGYENLEQVATNFKTSDWIAIQLKYSRQGANILPENILNCYYTLVVVKGKRAQAELNNELKNAAQPGQLLLADIMDAGELHFAIIFEGCSSNTNSTIIATSPKTDRLATQLQQAQSSGIPEILETIRGLVIQGAQRMWHNDGN